MLKFVLSLVLLAGLATNAQAQSDSNIIEELNPFDPNIEQTLLEIDEWYERETGQSPFLETEGTFPKCYRESCQLWIHVSKRHQELTYYYNGRYQDQWDVSTGVSGYSTPNFDRHPNGRIYDRYSSTRYPGGDYRGLGNMPYAIFIQGGFALHGTPEGNWSRLGKPASHGCIRMHPANAQKLNRLVRQLGIYNVWITVE